MISRALPIVPASPSDVFFCSPFRCSLRGEVCLQRQKAKVPHRFGKQPPRHYLCGSGKCEQGHKIAAQLAGHVPAVVPVSGWSGAGLAVRYCWRCSRPLEWRSDEARAVYLRRSYCGDVCRGVAAATSKATTAALRRSRVACPVCKGPRNTERAKACSRECGWVLRRGAVRQ